LEVLGKSEVMSIHVPVGLLKIGTVQSVNSGDYRSSSNGIEKLQSVDVKVEGYSVFTSDLHFTYADNNGVFIGAVPPKGNPALVLQQQGNKHQAISYYPTNPTTLPNIKPGELLLKNNDYTRLLFKDSNIILGSSNDKGLILNTSPSKINSSTFNNNFDYHFSFSQATRSLSGVVKREVVKSDISQSLKLVHDRFFNTDTKEIGLTSLLNISEGQEKPPIQNFLFAENRKVVYEYQYSSNNKDLQTELRYLTDKSAKSKFIENRHASRADVLSLSLNDPNYLIEKIEGNVVDIYGNLLDLNRFPIKTNISDSSKEKLEKNFLQLSEDQRRGIAFHFELNARKDLGETAAAPDPKDTSDYARNRSRFFFDVDKEGQFKINIPASSNSGNIPLLTRYENYTTVLASKNPEIDPNQQSFDQNVDILHDSFATGMHNHNLKYEEESKSFQKLGNYNRGLISVIKNGTEFSPIDRISKDLTNERSFAHIKHGTAHHDILATCVSHQTDLLSSYIYFKSTKEKSEWDSIFTSVAAPNQIVSDTIEIGKNAGGRSGSINLDGSIELNVGANTIDRQSIWLDTAGGMVANIGKDKNNISAAMSLDGELLLQIGGKGIPKGQDTRFDSIIPNESNFTSGVLDIRVVVQGPDQNSTSGVAVIRVDKNGITLMSPKSIYLKSNGSINLSSKSNVSIDGESVVIQGRTVEKSVLSLNGTI